VTVTTNAPRAQEADSAQAASLSFETLFLEHWPRIYGGLVRLLGDSAEAEDIALETFWRLYQRPPAERGNLGGWLYRVAMNLGYNALRATRRRIKYEETAGRDALAQAGAIQPEAEVQRAQEQRQVRAILGQLPPRDAQLLILRHSGLSYKELAAALNVSPASIGTLLARAEAEFEKHWRAANADG
jgi:RNA polymerase sigma-70 factor (ECF subfamily)